MMIKKYIVYFLAVLFIAGITSCSKDYLDRQPTGQVQVGDMFKNMTNVNVALNGVYRGLYRQYSGQEEDGHPAMMIHLDFMGEDIVHTATGTSYFRNSHRWIGHTSEINGLVLFAYRLYYSTISGANLILDNIDNVPGGTKAEKDAIKGELLALRGWSYFQLVQLYGKRYQEAIAPTASAVSKLGVPILTTYTTEPQPRATVAEVYNRINLDLDSAIIYLNAAPARKNKTHVDVSVARGFKARVALTTQDWPTAATYAAAARQGYSLMSNNDYLSGFNFIGNSEWMWGASQPSDQLPAYGSFFSYMSSNYNSVHTRTNVKLINSALWNAIPATDIRKKLWWDGTAADAVNFPGVINMLLKGPEPSQMRVRLMHRKYKVSDPVSTAGDIPYMRAAEMYLIEAEARVEMGQAGTGATVLTQLLRNRNPSYTQPSSLTVNTVLQERRIELWGEGFRFFDLKRRNLEMSRLGTGSISRLTNWSVIGEEEWKWQFMIPRRELENNPFMVQNERDSNEEN